MKNKKSKIIIPAMGLILLSTAASISGSVAWFTANRTAKFDAGEFAVVKTSENLVYDLTAGQNTTVGDSGTDHESIKFANTNALTHASYDHKHHNILEAKEDGSGILAVHSLQSTAAPTEEALRVTALGNTGQVYAAAIWQIDFKLSFGANEKKVGLFIDWSKTFMAKPTTFTQGQALTVQPTGLYTDIACTQAAPTFADDQPGVEGYQHTITEAEAKTYYSAPTATGKGFRIAFMPLSVYDDETKAGGVDRVLTKYREDDSENSHIEAKHVWYDAETPTAENYSVAASMAGYSYDGHYLLASDTTNTLPNQNGTTTLTAAKDYNTFLGAFAFEPNSVSTLSYLCVAWYEGTDPDIINRNESEEYEVMASELAFEAFNLTNS